MHDAWGINPTLPIFTPSLFVALDVKSTDGGDYACRWVAFARSFRVSAPRRMQARWGLAGIVEALGCGRVSCHAADRLRSMCDDCMSSCSVRTLAQSISCTEVGELVRSTLDVQKSASEGAKRLEVWIVETSSTADLR